MKIIHLAVLASLSISVAHSARGEQPAPAESDPHPPSTGAEGDTDAGTGQIGRIGGIIGWSTSEGASLGVDALLQPFPRAGESLRFSASIGQSVDHASVTFHDDTTFGAGPAFDLTLRRDERLAGSQYRFDSGSAGVEPRLTWAWAPGSTVALFAGYARESVSNPQSDISTLITPDVGDRDRVYLGTELAQNLSVGSPALSTVTYNLSQQYSRIDGDYDQWKFRASLAAGGALGGGLLSWSAGVRAGRVTTLGAASSVGDRFILGPASLRGFAFGGFGPRDTAAGGSVGLGGNAYAIARFDVMVPHAFGADTAIVPGVHVDFGSLWDLNAVNGTTDARERPRASAGFTLSAPVGPGQLRLNISQAIERQDYDRTEQVQLGFESRF